MFDNLGFEDQIEMANLVSKVDLSTIEKKNTFYKWKALDGTKTGLLKVIMKNKSDEKQGK